MNKGIKKALSLFLALVMVLSLLPLSAFAEEAEEIPESDIIAEEIVSESEVVTEECEPAAPSDEDVLADILSGGESDESEKLSVSGTDGNLSWTLDDNGVLTISGFGKMNDYSNDVPAPWGEYCGAIKSAIISSGVTSIGNYAFYYCYNMTGVSIPDSVTSIGDSSFIFCSSLTSVTIPSSVMRIGNGAFEGCSGLMSMIIPKSVTEIGYCAFEGCNSLTKVYYSGTRNQWDAIKIGEENICLTDADIQFDYSPEVILTRVASVKETCTTDGNIEYWYCTDNGKFYSDKDGKNEITQAQTVSPAEGHKDVTVPGKTPTCTETGLTDGMKCSVCGVITVEQTILPANGHNCEHHDAAEAQIGVAGNIEYWKCTVCGKYYLDSEFTQETTAKNVTIPAINPGNVKYKIHFDSNGGTGSMKDISTSWGKSVALTANAFKRTGYTFTGWDADDDGTVDYINKTKVSNLASVDGTIVTLKAVWAPNEYSVVYNGNKGTDEFGKTSITVPGIEYDALFIVAGNEFIRKGYVFTGWNTKADGKGKAYAPGDELMNMTAKAGGKFTLYAQWRAITYTVLFDGNGTEYTAAPLAATYDKTFKIPSSVPVYNGHTFLGWAKTRDAVKPDYKAKASAKNLTDVDGGDAVLYAVWSANTYTIVYNANGGKSAPAKETLVIGKDMGIISNDVPYFDNYTFAGWNARKDGKGRQYDPGEMIDDSDYPAKNKGTITLYAMWNYTVTFSSGNGDVKEMTLRYNVNEAPDTGFIRDGFTIAGWATSQANADKGTIKYKPAAVKNAAAFDTLYAVWKAKTYTVTFDANGGTGKMKAQTLTWDKSATLTANAFKKAGMKFAGWALIPDGPVAFENKGALGKDANITGGDGKYAAQTKLYAVWQADIKLALITDTGEVTDGGFNQAAYQGCVQFSGANGVPLKTYRPSSEETITATVEKAIKEGNNTVVLPGFIFGGAIETLAPKYPGVNFIALDIGEDDLGSLAGKIPSNVFCAQYQEEIAGFMAGYATVRLGYRKLGFLGGMEFPAVTRYGYGFVQGCDAAAKELGCTKDVSIKYAYGGQFWGDANITAHMNSWYSSGTQVVFACGGSIYTSAAEAAAGHNGKIIGVDVDQAAMINAHYGANMTVTSAMKGLAATVNAQLNSIQNGSFEGGKAEVLGMCSETPSENFVQLGTTSFNASFTANDYAALVSDLYNGRLTVSGDTDSKPSVSIAVQYQGNIGSDN